MTAKIIQLAPLGFPPTGNEIFEVSNQGNGSFQIALAIIAGARAQTIVSGAGTINIAVNDYTDYVVTTTAAVTLNLPSALLRNGVPITIVGANTGAPNITIAPFAGQTIFGLSNSLTITNSYGSYVLYPISTGLGDWYQK